MSGAGPIGFGAPVAYSSSGDNVDVVLKDIDVDGDLDVVTTSYTAQKVAVRFNLGGGVLSGETLYDNPSGHYTLVADIDADGLPDLVSTNFFNLPGLTVRRNLGAGLFGPVIPVVSINGPRCVVALDWDRDGDTDLAVAEFTGNQVRVIPQIGGGFSFPSATVYAVGANPKWIAAGDLDGDGWLEVVTANYTAGTLNVIRRDGVGTVTNVSYAANPKVSMVMLAHFNGDAVLDVASVTEEQKLSVRFGIGGGALAASQTTYTTAATLSQSLIGGDFDSDGDVDIAVSYLNSSDLSVFENAGAGTFPTHAEFPGGPQTIGIGAGDLDGDSDVDLAVTKTTPAGFAVLFNTLITAPPNVPVVNTVSPTFGSPGDPVTLGGSHFTGATSVTFGGIAASFSVNSDSEIEATVPPGARTGYVSVINGSGAGSGSTTFIVRPVLSSFSPPNGAIGDPVTLTGSNFTAATSVQFNGTSASFTVISDQSIQASVPAMATTGPITVANVAGTATSATNFAVVPAGRTLNLSWDDCASFGTGAKEFACVLNAGPPFELFGSFTPPTGITEYAGLTAELTFQSAGTMLPDWWKLGSGECRSTALQSVFDYSSGPFSCADPYLGALNMALTGHLWQTGMGGPNKARLLLQGATSTREPLSSENEYYAFTVRIQRSNSYGAGSCWGCTVDMSITLDRIQLFQPYELEFDPVIITPDIRNSVTWNSAVTGVPEPAIELALAGVTPRGDQRGVEVAFSLPNAAPATLVLFDIAGRVRGSHSLDGMGAGSHNVTLTARNPLSPGIYYVRLMQDGSKVTKQFSLAR